MSPSSERPQVETWLSDSAAEAWQKGYARRAAAMAPATTLMLELAGVRRGARVLDVAAGSGDQSIEAARVVGPEGSVLATDLSPSMLKLAGQAAKAAGLANVQTMVANAQELDLEPDSFDAAICRNGMMFFPDRHKALSGIRRVLKPGAKFAAVVWSAAENNPYLTVCSDVARPWLEKAGKASALGIALSMGAAGILEDELVRAGFRDVAVHTARSNRHFSSAVEALDSMQNGPGGQNVAVLPEAEQQEIWRKVEAELRRREGPSGLDFPSESLVGVGTK